MCRNEYMRYGTDIPLSVFRHFDANYLNQMIFLEVLGGGILLMATRLPSRKIRAVVCSATGESGVFWLSQNLRKQTIGMRLLPLKLRKSSECQSWRQNFSDLTAFRPRSEISI